MSSLNGSGAWKSEVFYTGPAGNLDLINNSVPHDKLIEFFGRLDMTNEAITTIWAYKQKLGGWSVGSTPFAHFFLILKTENFYWRIEKGVDGIHVKTSSELRTLLNPSDNPEIAGGQPQTGSSISNAGKTILNLFGWIKDNNILGTGYDFIYKNCIHFAYSLYKWLLNNAPLELENMIEILKTVTGRVGPLIIWTGAAFAAAFPVHALTVGCLGLLNPSTTPLLALSSREVNGSFPSS